MTDATQIAEGDVWQEEMGESLAVTVCPDQRRDLRRGRTGTSKRGLIGLSSLADVIEREIAPRLKLRQRTVKPGVCPVRAVEPANESVVALAEFLLQSDAVAARSFVERKHSDGASLESLYIDLLAPAGRYLGHLWSDDRCDFTAVTFGMGHLQQLLRELSPMFQSEFHQTQPSDRILLVSTPGDQHTFGLSMVAEFLRRAGWDVWGGPLSCAADLFSIVRSDWFDAVGLSIGHDVSVDVLSQTIRTIRRSSRNRLIGVIVGGPWVLQHPEIVVRIGADASAVDGRSAPINAKEVVNRLRRGG
jgi:MerR family transcriptional regulator, light-induced transcriptional regulator